MPEAALYASLNRAILVAISSLSAEWLWANVMHSSQPNSQVLHWDNCCNCCLNGESTDIRKKVRNFVGTSYMCMIFGLYNSKDALIIVFSLCTMGPMCNVWLQSTKDLLYTNSVSPLNSMELYDPLYLIVLVLQPASLLFCSILTTLINLLSSSSRLLFSATQHQSRQTNLAAGEHSRAFMLKSSIFLSGRVGWDQKTRKDIVCRNWIQELVAVAFESLSEGLRNSWYVHAGKDHDWCLIA